MRTAAKVFYLAVFALLELSHAGTSGSGTSKPRSTSPDVCAVSPPISPINRLSARQRAHTAFNQFEPNSIVTDACASYSTLDTLNTALHPYVHSLTQDTDFFSHYRLNLFSKKCPFWSDDNGMCGNIACAVNTLDNEEDIPLVWRAEELGKLEGPKAKHPDKSLQRERPAQKPLQGQLGEDIGESCVVEYDDECDERDYCVPDDEGASAKGDYVSLVDNPERFTGYSGAGAQQVWEAIYRENCFIKPQPEVQQSDISSPFGSNPLQAKAALDLKNVMKEHNVQQGVQQAIAKGSGKTPVDELDFEDECLEKRVFYRVVSGMHASISTHLCWDYLNQTTGEWAPNLECYRWRLHPHPERISNLYFNYALLVRAVGKLRNYWNDYTFCSADPIQNRHTKTLVKTLSKVINSGDNVFDESVMFRSADAVGLKEDFRNRFRNVSRVMDCVGCDKCRLWGKLQTNGYGTALKVLFEFDDESPEDNPPLRRTELVALLNTLDRVSHSLTAIKEFNRMLEAEAIRSSKVPGVERSEAATETLSSKAAIETESDGWEDNTYPSELRRKPAPTLAEEFWAEFGLVVRAFRFIFIKWVELPRKLWHIFLWEVGRLWAIFLGLPAPPRSWQIRVPNHDEF
ncbi:endoplasmic oxidoreductin [Trichodelitschia bisporula]|uniref:Endoplasmic oxidoreductin n=1 Tax=Trichodelitschia bisporula TaxID=703511 RepID=A0A6G1I7G1_9PEZI|nr:endoplasmic oxidoreductin [Trichodelitschia bisporula]